MQRNIKALIVVPENNTTMEPEIAALCPALAPISVARVKRPARTLLLEDLPAYGEATLDAIVPFADRQFDLVIYGCTFLPGADHSATILINGDQNAQERACTLLYEEAHLPPNNWLDQAMEAISRDAGR